MNTSYILISVMVMGSAFMLILGVRAHQNRKAAEIAAAMANSAGALTSLRDIQMAKSSSERILMPMARRFTMLGRLLTPSQNLGQLQQDLIRAGMIDKISVTDFMGIRVLGGIGAAALTYFFFGIKYDMISAMLFSFAGFMVGLYFPNIWLKSRIGQRQKAIQRMLPDALDMMSICVDAGLGFEAAIQKVAFQWENELAHELRTVIRELRVGLSRAEALHNLVDRTGVSDIASFVGVLVQADRLGIAIKDVLHTQAVQMRLRRRQRAEESAAKTPLKMMFPMVFFIFPAMFAVILGPAVPRFATMF